MGESSTGQSVWEWRQPTQAEHPLSLSQRKSLLEGRGESCKLKGRQRQSPLRSPVPTASAPLGVSWFAPGPTHKRIGLPGPAPGGSGRPIVALGRRQSAFFPSSPHFPSLHVPRGVNFLTVPLPSVQSTAAICPRPIMANEQPKEEEPGVVISKDQKNCIAMAVPGTSSSASSSSSSSASAAAASAPTLACPPSEHPPPNFGLCPPALFAQMALARPELFAPFLTPGQGLAFSQNGTSAAFV